MEQSNASGIVSRFVSENRIISLLLKADLINRSALARLIQKKHNLDKKSFHAILAALRRLKLPEETRSYRERTLLLGIDMQEERNELFADVKVKLITGISVLLLHESSPAEEIGDLISRLSRRSTELTSVMLPSSRAVIFPDEYKREVLEKLARYATDYKSGLAALIVKTLAVGSAEPAFILALLAAHAIRPVVASATEKELFTLLKKGDASKAASLLGL